jgi:hypothetical protein
MTYEQVFPKMTETATEGAAIWTSVMIGGADIDAAIADAVSKIG